MTGEKMTGEFDLIRRYFLPLASPAGLGLADDAACFAPPPGRDIVVTKDMLVQSVHFRPDDPAESIGYKALAVNLSDLAAKGAEPLHYWLGLAMPRNTPDVWLEAFARGLAAQQAQSGISLAGGDTSLSPGGIVLSITALGSVSSGAMTRRNGAKPGDDIYVSGTLGDGALGLRCLDGRLPPDKFLIQRYRMPDARLALGQALRGVATAAADVSDGLMADLGHICAASGVGARVNEGDLPKSKAGGIALARAESLSPLVWSGGDDYELVFTAPKAAGVRIAAIAVETGTPITHIGEVTEEIDLRLVDPTGWLVQIDQAGYQHF